MEFRIDFFLTVGITLTLSVYLVIHLLAESRHMSHIPALEDNLLYRTTKESLISNNSALVEK